MPDTVLVADVGGTNTTFALVRNGDVLEQQAFRTHEIPSFAEAVTAFLDGKEVERACFAAAGPVETVRGRRRVKLTNASLTLDERALERSTSLRHVRVINDFEALGHAADSLKRSERKVLRAGRKRDGPRILVGAGTGLGKVLLVKDDGSYAPVKSEFGFTDLPIQDEDELRIAEFIRQSENVTNVTYGIVLSGPGLERLYEFHAHKRLPADLVVKRRDAHARDAIKDFVRFYARACRNELVDNWATGGLYLAGGIAAKNPGLFGRSFIHELCSHDDKVVRRMLEDVPVTIITDQGVALRGAAKEVSP